MFGFQHLKTDFNHCVMKYSILIDSQSSNPFSLSPFKLLCSNMTKLQSSKGFLLCLIYLSHQLSYLFTKYNKRHGYISYLSYLFIHISLYILLLTSKSLYAYLSYLYLYISILSSYIYQSLFILIYLVFISIYLSNYLFIYPSI